MKLSALKDFDNLPDKVRAALPVTVLNNIQKMRTDTGQPVPHTPLIHPPRHRKRKRKPPKRTGTGKQNKNSKRKHPPNRSPWLINSPSVISRGWSSSA